jgi:hypothetical protein
VPCTRSPADAVLKYVISALVHDAFLTAKRCAGFTHFCSGQAMDCILLCIEWLATASLLESEISVPMFMA